MFDLPPELRDLVYADSSLGCRDRAKLLQLNKEVRSRSIDLFKDRTYIAIRPKGSDKTSQNSADSSKNAQEISVRLFDYEMVNERLRQEDSTLAQHAADESKLQTINIEFLHAGDLDSCRTLSLSTLNIPESVQDKATVQVVTGKQWDGPYHCYLVSIHGDKEQKRPTEHYIGASRRSCPLTTLANLAGTLLHQGMQADADTQVKWVNVRSTDWANSRPPRGFEDIPDPAERQAFLSANMETRQLAQEDSEDYTRVHLRCISQTEFEATEAGRLLYNYLKRETAFESVQGSF